MLPLPGAITSQLDKASIVRLTIAYLRLREFAAHGDPPWNRDGRFDGKSTLKGKISQLLHISNATVCFKYGSMTLALLVKYQMFGSLGILNHFQTEIQFSDTAKLEILQINQIYISFFDLGKGILEYV